MPHNSVSRNQSFTMIVREDYHGCRITPPLVVVLYGVLCYWMIGIDIKRKYKRRIIRLPRNSYKSKISFAYERLFDTPSFGKTVAKEREADR